MAKKAGKFRKIMVFDTTLRDGEQSPGATLTHEEKLKIAAQLEKLKVDVIEAGFPIASEDDFRAVKEISETVKGTRVAALARALPKDIDAAWNAVKGAAKPRIHTFMSTSSIHLKHQFKKTEKEALKMSVGTVKHARKLCEDVEFSAMDATRTNSKFLFEIFEAVIDAGAKTINVPDTVGYTQPAEFGKLIAGIRENVPNIREAVISVHCHNDLGLAVANSLEAVRNGAGQVECTVNGLGERAGNASLEEIAMALHTRRDFFEAKTGIKLDEIFRSSKMVSDFTGIMVQPNKAIVGKNAFAHEAGIHQQGIIASSSTYEIINPKTVGAETRLVIGKHSGKHATEKALKELGFALTEAEVSEVIGRIKALADKQKKVLPEDIEAIAFNVSRRLGEEEQIIKLDELVVLTGNKIKPTATVKLLVDGKDVAGFGKGVGPVDAASQAIKSVVGNEIKLKEYNIKAITGGTDALADVMIKLEDKSGKIFSAESVNEDVIMASVEALLKGANKVLNYRKNAK
ncbi:MAG: 2-isopropylmalate synthase [Candidatus Diapherotrites archaeon]